MGSPLPSWVIEASSLPLCFAQVREDALLDLDVLSTAEGPLRVMMVASGGCTAALLAASPRVQSLHLVDPNPSQVALCRLKLDLLATAEPFERESLLGHAPLPARERLVEVSARLSRLSLDPSSLGPPAFWSAVGPDHAGRYEQLFAALRRRLDPEMVASVLATDAPAEAAALVHPDTPLGRALDAAFDDVFAMPNLIGLFGEQAVSNPAEPFARHFVRRLRHTLATLPAATNPYLAQVLAGRYPKSIAAPWLAQPRPARMPAVRCSVARMDEVLSNSPGPLDVIFLSNILDWLSPREAHTTLSLTYEALAPGGIVLIRQLNSTLDIPSLGPALSWQRDAAARLLARDRSFFYRALHKGQRSLS